MITKIRAALVAVLVVVAMITLPAGLSLAVQKIDNAAIAEAGLREVGTTRAAGWNQPGECVKSVQRWIAAAGGNFGGSGVVSGYVNSGARGVSLARAIKGDVIQYTASAHQTSG